MELLQSEERRKQRMQKQLDALQSSLSDKELELKRKEDEIKSLRAELALN